MGPNRILSIPPMPRVIEITNPLEPWKNHNDETVAVGSTVMDYLRGRYGAEFVYFKHPTLITVNGFGVLRAQWDVLKLADGDLVKIVAVVGLTAIQVLYLLYAALVVASVAIALTAKTNVPIPGQGNNVADPVYTLKGQTNQVKLGSVIEVPYGRNRLYPSYGALPYNEYINNDQYLYQLLCLGQGQFSIESLNIEDTPIDNFADVTYELCPPGTRVTLFPDNVITSVEVSNIELYGPNEPEADDTFVEDSPGDDTADPPIAATGHYAFTSAGPFIANPTGTTTTHLAFDVSFPAGLYTQDDAGNLGNSTVELYFEGEQVDDSGTPIPGTSRLFADWTKTLSTITPQRFTINVTVPEGRWQVMAHRVNDKDTSDRSGNEAHWESLRAYLPSVQDYGAVTMLAVKAKATNSLNDNAQNRVNTWCVRYLPAWDIDSQTWLDATPTRSLIWAFVDIFKAAYGGRYADIYFNLDKLATLNAGFDSRGEFFDWVFDQGITVWDAASTAALVGRGVPMLNGSLITCIRDEPKTLPTQIFNQEIIVKGSFKYEVKLAAVDEFDGLEVTYVDPTSGQQETVLALLPESGDNPAEEGTNPDKITLSGCQDRQLAYNWGMWKRATDRYRRNQATFSTGLEGNLPTYLDLVACSHDVPRWGIGGMVNAIDETNTILTLSEPVSFSEGINYKIYLRQKNGVASGILACTAGADANHVVLTVALDVSNYVWDNKSEPPIFNFGPENFISTLCLISNLTPGTDDAVEITVSKYRTEPYAFDDYIAPAIGQTQGSPPKGPDLATVTGLIVVAAPGVPNEVQAQWIPFAGAKFYVVQMSYDSESWETISDYQTSPTVRFTCQSKFIYVRVQVVLTAAGGWAYWTGNAPIPNSNIIFDNGVDPNPINSLVVASGIEALILTWNNPTNTPLKAIHFYEAAGLMSDAIPPTQPTIATILVPVVQNSPTGFYFRTNLADGTKKTYWGVAEALNGRFSAVSSPVSGTVVVWPVVSGIDSTITALTGDVTNRVLRQATAPTSPNLYDVWYDTANNNIPYIWDGTAWVQTGDSRVTAIVSQVNDATTGLPATRAEVFSGSSTWAVGDAALASSISTVSSSAAFAQLTANAAITNAASAQSTANGAQSTANTAVTAAATANSAAGTAQSTANAAVTSSSTAIANTTSLAAEYVLNVSTTSGGTERVAGFRITTLGGAGGSSEFVIQADKFAVINNGDGSSIRAPFAVVSGVCYLDTAIIRDGTIDNAKITTLDANKINAGTLTAMDLAAGVMATDYQLYNSGLGASSTFPVVGYQVAEDGTHRTGLQSSPQEIWMINVYGWATGSGYALDRFGKSDMCFLCFENGGASVVSGGLVNLEIIWNLNGGATQQVNPFATGATNNNGSLNINGTLKITGLSSTDTLAFGVRVSASSSDSDQFNVANLTVIALNL